MITVIMVIYSTVQFYFHLGIDKKKSKGYDHITFRDHALANGQ